MMGNYIKCKAIEKLVFIYYMNTVIIVSCNDKGTYFLEMEVNFNARTKKRIL